MTEDDEYTEEHDWQRCHCADCSDERAIRTAERNYPEARL